MDYNTLLDLVVDLGYRLAMHGAETFRIEESINRILAAYGIEAEAFAIPNYLMVSIKSPDGKPITRMRRIGYHGNDLDTVERYSNLSRRICAEKPDPTEAIAWMKQTDASKHKYSLPMYLAGHFLGACGFSVFFGGTLIDSLCAGICGILIGLVHRLTNHLKVNPFFSTIASAFIMAFAAYAMGMIGIANNTDTVVIGALMILVPGLLITNAMRDIIFGDTNSGTNRIVQVLLVAAAIALGTGTAWNFSNVLWGISANTAPVDYLIWIQLLACAVGCLGFSIIFNIQFPGCFLCVLGGVFAWGTYCLVLHFGGGDIAAYFFAALVAAMYSEIMARIRKYPAISYLVVSIFPLIPGAGIYYSTNRLVLGDMTGFANQGTHTVAIAGALAVGILMVSTLVRLWGEWRQKKKCA